MDELDDLYNKLTRMPFALLSELVSIMPADSAKDEYIISRGYTLDEFYQRYAEQKAEHFKYNLEIE